MKFYFTAVVKITMGDCGGWAIDDYFIQYTARDGCKYWYIGHTDNSKPNTWILRKLSLFHCGLLLLNLKTLIRLIFPLFVLWAIYTYDFITSVTKLLV